MVYGLIALLLNNTEVSMNSKLRVLFLLILSSFAVPCARSQAKVVFQTLRASLPRIDAPATFAATGEPLGNGFSRNFTLGPPEVLLSN